MEINRTDFATLKNQKIYFLRGPFGLGRKVGEYEGALGPLLEQRSTHLWKTFMPLGAFSYSLSFHPAISEVGRYCSIATNLKVLGENHPTDWLSTSPWQYKRWGKFSEPEKFIRDYKPEKTFRWEVLPVTIGNDVWVGQDVSIRGGVSIGNGAVIAAGSMVTKDVPAFAVVGGIPAKIIRYRFGSEIIDKIENLQWWKYSFHAFLDMKPSNPEVFLSELERRILLGDVVEIPIVRKTAKQWIENPEQV